MPFYGRGPLLTSPKIRVIKKMMMKIQKSHNAIVSAPAAIPPNPKIAAIIATIKNINDQ
jgi:hypothetical protein